MSDVWHAVTCPVRRRWRKRRYHQPFWRDDKVAQMLGVAGYGCPRCGRGSIDERDARLDPFLTVADVLCAVRDHIANRIRGERCPTCFARTRDLPAHIAIDHAEVTS